VSLPKPIRSAAPDGGLQESKKGKVWLCWTLQCLYQPENYSLKDAFPLSEKLGTPRNWGGGRSIKLYSRALSERQTYWVDLRHFLQKSDTKEKEGQKDKKRQCNRRPTSTKGPNKLTLAGVIKSDGRRGEFLVETKRFKQEDEQKELEGKPLREDCVVRLQPYSDNSKLQNQQRGGIFRKLSLWSPLDYLQELNKDHASSERATETRKRCVHPTMVQGISGKKSARRGSTIPQKGTVKLN